MKINILYCLLCHAYFLMHASDEKNAIPIGQKLIQRASDLSNLVEKNKISCGLATATGGIAGYGVNQLVHHINEKKEEPIKIIQENKITTTIILTGLGSLFGFGIFSMTYGKKMGKIEGLIESAQKK